MADSNGIPRRPRIGLALSGGGFRASIFHLGVIRRLEELGIMQDVSVISTVSGGSIVGAYYVVEMERRLRASREAFADIEAQEGDPVTRNKAICAALAAARLQTFERIAEDFFLALDRNIRSRSLVFSPIHHPILFFRSLWPTYSRSDIIQREYDQFLFRFHPLDQLPSVTDDDAGCDYLAGPRLVINTTSLLTGERKGFSRIPVSGISEMQKPNTNVLLLSRVVGASAGVPGLFPPTPILGDSYVDGGVSDNQGLDGLLDDGRRIENTSPDLSPTTNATAAIRDYDCIIVSDASGQLEPVHEIGRRSAKVLPRTFSIFQHELRNKTIRRLIAWRRGEETHVSGPTTGRADPPEGGSTNGNRDAPCPREFAYTHLFLNLKQRMVRSTPEAYRVTKRVPSEYIQALGRIRTDLDQFSFVEREALMYHGYTTIDAQLRRWCPALLKHYHVTDTSACELRTAPLFTDQTPDDEKSEGIVSREGRKRARILNELEAGSQPVFLFRSFLKYRLRSLIVYIATLGAPLIAVYSVLSQPAVTGWLENSLGAQLELWWNSSSPRWLYGWFERLGGSVKLPFTTKGFALVAALALSGYLLLWVTFVVMRHLTLAWDRTVYKELTTSEPSSVWPPTRPRDES